MKEAGYEWDVENLQLTKILPVKELSDGINIDKQKLVEWSEEDENKIDTIIQIYHPSKKIMDWLKSLKERYAWKPSKEQMDALNCARWNAPFNIEILDSLYNDLKKLKGE